MFVRDMRATQRNATADCVLLSYPEFNTGYNARDHCIMNTAVTGVFCVINYPAPTGNNEMKG